MPLAGEALLLARRDHDAVLQQGGGGVVVEAGDPEDVGRGRGHQNWCRAARSGPSGFGSWARQKEGSGASRRSRGSWPKRRITRPIGPTESDVDDGEEDRRPHLAEPLEEGGPARRRRGTSGRGAGRPSSTSTTTAARASTFQRRGRAANQPTASCRLKWLKLLQITAFDHRAGRRRGSKRAGGYNPRDGDGRARPATPDRAGGALGAAARSAAPLDGPGGGRREGGRAVRARDVAAQLRAVLPPRRPAPLRPRDARARAAQLVGGAPARRQRAHAGGAACRARS